MAVISGILLVTACTGKNPADTKEDTSANPTESIEYAEPLNLPLEENKPETEAPMEGAVAFFIQNPDIMSDAEKANPIPTGWIFFPKDEWQVNKEQMRTLDVIAQILKKQPEEYICYVVGIINREFASDVYSMKLSEKMAREVARIMREKYGFSDDRIIVDFKGKSLNYGLF